MYSRSEVNQNNASTYTDCFFSSSCSEKTSETIGLKKQNISSVKRLDKVLIKLFEQSNVKMHFLALTCYHQKPPKASSYFVSSCNSQCSQPLPPGSWKDCGLSAHMLAQFWLQYPQNKSF